MNFTIKARLVLLILAGIFAIAFIGHSGYYSSNHSLECFKRAASEKIPAIVAIDDYSYGLSRMRNTLNEITASYSDAMDAKKKFDAQRSALVSSFEELRMTAKSPGISATIEEAGKKNSEIIDLFQDIIERHELKRKLVARENGIIMPMNAFITAMELDHVTWVARMEQDIIDGAEFRGQADHELCAFEKWYLAHDTSDVALNAIISKFHAEHVTFHGFAKKINSALAGAGGKDAAMNIFRTEVGPALKRLGRIFDEFRFHTVTNFIENATRIDRETARTYELEKSLTGDCEAIRNAINKEISKFIEEAESGISGASFMMISIGTASAVFLALLGTAIIWSVVSANSFLLSESGKLTDAVLNGKLDVRGDENGTIREFRPVVHGINDIMDAFAKPLKVTAGYVSNISRGFIPSKITEEYRGDFNEIKNNINTCIDALEALIIRDGGSVLEAAAAKDLTARIKGNYQGAFGTMKDNINRALGNIDGALRDILESAKQVSTIAHEISSNAQGVSQGAQSQAASVEEISTSISEMTRSTGDIAITAGNTARLALETSEDAGAGENAVRNSMEAMGQIMDSSKHISKISSIIGGIADQTNLLALNASIEAARAGEYGKGFAVVANEVRSLAKSCSEAANQISVIIREMEEKIAGGSKLSLEAGYALKKIRNGVEMTTGAIGKTSDATDKQKAMAGEVLRAVESVAAITEQNAGSSEQLAASAEELSAAAESLRSTIESFNITRGRSA